MAKHKLGLASEPECVYIPTTEPVPDRELKDYCLREAHKYVSLSASMDDIVSAAVSLEQYFLRDVS